MVLSTHFENNLPIKQVSRRLGCSHTISIYISGNNDNGNYRCREPHTKFIYFPYLSFLFPIFPSLGGGEFDSGTSLGLGLVGVGSSSSQGTPFFLVVFAIFRHLDNLIHRSEPCNSQRCHDFNRHASESLMKCRRSSKGIALDGNWVGICNSVGEISQFSNAWYYCTALDLCQWGKTRSAHRHVG